MKEVLKLSPQAVGAIMMAVQNSFLAVMEGKPKEECDAAAMILDFELEETQDGLLVRNPPTCAFLEEPTQE